MRAVQQDWEQHGHNTFTIGKSAPNASLKLLASNASDDMQPVVVDRSNRQIKVIENIAHLLPAFRATWTAQDGKFICAQFAFVVSDVPRFFVTCLVGDERAGPQGGRSWWM